MSDKPLYVDVEYRSQIGEWLNDHGLVGAAAEIGVLAGSYSLEVLSKWKGTRYYMVDPWMPQSKDVYRERNDDRNYDQLYRECHAIAERDPRVRLIRKLSVDASREIDDGSLDFVFIDANHSYGAVLADMDAWWPKVIPGGVFAGHDYGNDTNYPNWCEVKKAVDRWCAQRRLMFAYSRCNSWWVLKPEEPKIRYPLP